MRIGLNTSDWGKKAGTFFKKAKGEIKDTANLVRDKTEAFVESFKEEVNAGTSDGVTLSSAIDHGESVSYQPETFIEEVGPEENKGLSKKEKGALIGGGVGFLLTGGLLGTGGGAWFGKEVAEHGFQGAMENTGEKLGKGFNAVKGWCDDTFKSGKETNTSTMEVKNGMTEQTVSTNGNASNPMTLTVIE